MGQHSKDLDGVSSQGRSHDGAFDVSRLCLRRRSRRSHHCTSKCIKRFGKGVIVVLRIPPQYVLQSCFAESCTNLVSGQQRTCWQRQSSANR